jgi:hypothetical protein
LSAELKTILESVSEEDCKRVDSTIEDNLPRYKFLLLEVRRIGKFDNVLSVEGAEQPQAINDEKLLELLSRANLVRGETKFTHRNVYRQYELTGRGMEIADQLAAES